MHQNEAAVLEKVNEYKYTVETQDRDAFFSLWAENCETTLISIGTCYYGSESIYRDFLLGRIQKAYSAIELEIQKAEVRFLNDTAAVVIFSYQTHCTRRETGEPYGIAGLETQVYVKEGETWKLAHVQYAKQ